MSPLGFVLLVAALCGVALCYEEKLYITADNVLEEVCVNDVTVGPLTSAFVVGRLDKIPLAAGWNDQWKGCLTVRAYNTKSVTWGGILACVKPAVLYNLVWQCVEMPQLAGASCCSSCNNPIWDLPSTANLFQFRPNEHHTKNFVKKLPEMCTSVKGFTQWVWDNKRLQPHVCCRARACAAVCLSCELTGPGNCDPGKCLYGPTGLTAAPLCNYKCCVNVQTFQGSGAASYPKATIINNSLNETYEVPITLDQAAFWLDITTCMPGAFYETSDPAGTTQQTNIWAYDTALTGFVLVDLASGNGLIWTGIQKFIGDGTYADLNPAIYGQGIATASFCLTGYPLDMASEVESDIVQSTQY
jgi:hypothetical protein